MTNDWEQRAGKQHHKARRSLKAPLCKGSCHANSVTEGLPQRAVAEQAAESLRVRPGVAGKILARAVLEKVIICHIPSSKYFANSRFCAIITPSTRALCPAARG